MCVRVRVRKHKRVSQTNSRLDDDVIDVLSQYKAVLVSLARLGLVHCTHANRL